MHRIPRFFTPKDKKHKSSMDSKQKGRGIPKLDRRLARKNIDYEPSTSSSSDYSSALRTGSPDLSPLGNRTSFRIQGIDGEFNEIFRSLGLSGPDDFSIPTAAWEARKVQSSLDFPRSRLQHLESPRIDASIKLNNCGDACELLDSLIDTVGVSNVSHEQNDTRASVGVGSDQAPRFKHIMANDVAGEQCESIKLYDSNDGCEGGVDVCGLSDRLIETVQVSNVSHNQNNSSESVGFAIAVETSRCGGGGGGIKGVRPPVLAPPPSYLRPAIDDTSSTWDILKSFAPVGDGRGFISLRGFRSDNGNHDEEEEGEEEEEVAKPDEGLDGARLGETVHLSESCSFTTTSNDDDSSSTTTEPTSNISPNDRFRRIISHWEKGELLGRGSFGSVYEGIADGGFFIAVKEVSLLDQGDLGRQSIFQLEQEIALLSQFQHENIVQYYGTDKDESNLYIFLELVTKGSLLQLYQKYHLQDSTVSSYTRQILHGLKYLHERNVVHRDIKCANILVDANGSVKLADFGLAKVTKLNDVKSCKGTPFWMAPEVVKRNNQGYGLAADIWSLGCSVLEMLTRQIPYSDLESMQALFRIGRGMPPLVPDFLSADARDFILQCLQVNSSARPTASQLLDHSFVKRPLSISSGSSSPYSHRV